MYQGRWDEVSAGKRKGMRTRERGDRRRREEGGGEGERERKVREATESNVYEGRLEQR